VIANGSEDNTLVIWDLASCVQIYKLDVHADAITDLKIHVSNHLPRPLIVLNQRCVELETSALFINISRKALW
jgi:WD40 repeat protein